MHLWGAVTFAGRGLYDAAPPTPGTGVQHLAKRTSTSPMPRTLTPDDARRCGLRSPRPWRSSGSTTTLLCMNRIGGSKRSVIGAVACVAGRSASWSVFAAVRTEIVLPDRVE